MLIKLQEKNRQQVVEYLSKEPSINLFLLGDIENYGFNNDFQEIWGSFDKDGNLKGVLLRYYESFIPYFNEDCEDKKEIIEKINSFQVNELIVSGKESVINYIKDSFGGGKVKNTFFCELTYGEKLIKGYEEVKKAEVTDVQRLTDFINTIEEFDIGESYGEKLEKEIITKSGRVYYIENENGEIVCSAQATAENSKSAMIIGVATGEKFRNKGYITKCLSKLVYDLLDEGKISCLFFDNKNAGRIYHKLGFKDIENWTLITK